MFPAHDQRPLDLNGLMTALRDMERRISEQTVSQINDLRNEMNRRTVSFHSTPSMQQPQNAQMSIEQGQHLIQLLSQLGISTSAASSAVQARNHLRMQPPPAAPTGHADPSIPWNSRTNIDTRQDNRHESTPTSAQDMARNAYSVYKHFSYSDTK